MHSLKTYLFAWTICFIKAIKFNVERHCLIVLSGHTSWNFTSVHLDALLKFHNLVTLMFRVFCGVHAQYLYIYIYGVQISNVLRLESSG
jgi:hypothetical protein